MRTRVETLKDNRELLANALFRTDTATKKGYASSLLSPLYQVQQIVQYDNLRHLGPEAKGYAEEAVSMVLGVIQENLVGLGERVTSTHNGTESQIEYLTVMHQLARFGNHDQIQALVQTLENSSFDPRAALDQGTQKWIYQETALLLFKRGSEAQQSTARALIEELSDRSDDSKESAWVMISQLYGDRYPDVQQQGHALLDRIIQRYELSTEELVKAWRRGASLEANISYNLRAIDRLESVDPGSAKFLHENFGINDFSRYPVEMLLEQKNDFEKNDLPYGVVIFPRDDWNGAFQGDQEIFRQVHRQMTDKYRIRIFECASKSQIARALIGLDQRYAPREEDGETIPGHRISFAILGGHGSPHSIDFGGGGSKYSLTTYDLMGRGVSRSGKFFEPEPTIIMVSCSTGAESGIGQEMSEMMGATVIAPDIPTGLSGINVQFNEAGKPAFDVKYGNDNVRKLYIKGKKDA
jgi:hypothetical protein